MKKSLIVLSLAFTLIISGCATTSSGIAPSTHPIQSDDQVTKLGEADGASWGFSVAGIPFSMASTNRAVDSAIKNGGGDALQNVRMSNSRYIVPVPPTFVLHQTYVTGEAIKINE